MKICYVPKVFTAAHTDIITRAVQLCESYERQGFILTLRQLYYQFVSRGWIANRDTEYKRLGGIISDARRAGLIDWNHLEDRTRFLRVNSHWDSPDGVIQSAAYGYKKDLWSDQDYRVEVWIEKDALVGVIEGVCNELDVGAFSCRGYTSDSEIWRAGRRLRNYVRQGQTPIILHLGDHDPSGIDMTRDITDRLALFSGDEVEIDRLALNMDQVNQYSPPPNPAKTTDARFAGYVDIYGDESWELDALEPNVIVDLVRRAVEAHTDADKMAARREEVEHERLELTAASNHWSDVVAHMEEEGYI
jgi:hypothetical protein